MGRCYVPSDGPVAWQTFLADPAEQWKTRLFCQDLAHFWEAGDRLPNEVASLIKTIPRYKDEEPELLMAMPEWKVPLPGGSRDSQTDVLALIGVGGDLMVAAVEGKVSEPFGDTIDKWYANPSKGKRHGFNISAICWERPFRLRVGFESHVARANLRTRSMTEAA